MIDYEEIIEKDENGNITLMQRSDGFREESVYYKNKLIKQTTYYPNGIIEIEKWSY